MLTDTDLKIRLLCEYTGHDFGEVHGGIVRFAHAYGLSIALVQEYFIARLKSGVFSLRDLKVD